MSQTKLHQLLYAARASGSTDCHDESNAEKTAHQAARELSTEATPQDISARYDFRTRSPHAFAESC
jgi:hypothetical protein